MDIHQILTVSSAFLAYSLVPVILERPMNLWLEHTRNFWSNQVWFDLLLGIGAAWSLIIPRAKLMNMSIILWGMIILATGSIGFLAFYGRLLYLEEKKA